MSENIDIVDSKNASIESVFHIYYGSINKWFLVAKNFDVDKINFKIQVKLFGELISFNSDR